MKHVGMISNAIGLGSDSPLGVSAVGLGSESPLRVSAIGSGSESPLGVSAMAFDPTEEPKGK